MEFHTPARSRQGTDPRPWAARGDLLRFPVCEGNCKKATKPTEWVHYYNFWSVVPCNFADCGALLAKLSLLTKWGKDKKNTTLSMCKGTENAPNRENTPLSMRNCNLNCRTKQCTGWIFPILSHPTGEKHLSICIQQCNSYHRKILPRSRPATEITPELPWWEYLCKMLSVQMYLVHIRVN